MYYSISTLSAAVLCFSLSKFASAQTPRTCASPSISPDAFSATKFDYVIIGGGTAGLALASRLADDHSVQIGVIEAGVYHPIDPLIDIPGNVGVGEGHPDLDWAFKSVPQPGLNGNQMPVPRGKMLGGSSGLNFLAWNRASSAEYDVWNQFGKGVDWSFNGFLPYFKDTTTTYQNQTNPFPGIPANETKADFDPNFVGFNGPIQSSYNNIYPDPVFPYVQSLNNLGVPTNANPDNGSASGIINSRSSLDRTRGVRSYAVEYYCRSVSQKNFKVLTNAQVTKILFSASGQSHGSYTATGVQFVSNGKTFTVKASKEVHLSAGSIQTPQLLELSGIGNATLLKSLDITTLIDLPGVGENLQDHIFAGVEYEVKPGVLTFDALHNNATYAAEQSALYNATGTGLLSTFDSTLTWLPFHFYLNSSETTTLQGIFEKVPIQNGTSQSLQHDIQRQWLQEGVVPQNQIVLHSGGQLPPINPNSSYFTAFCGILHPWAHGFVHINTTDPLAHPVIDERYFDNDFDIQAVLSCIKLLLKLQDTAPVSDIITNRTSPAVDIQSDEDLINYIKSNAMSSSHPIGTAAMAPRELGGVVDADLKVYGTTNLRVVDASIIPIIVGANPQQTIYAIGEKVCTFAVFFPEPGGFFLAL
ncbi:alcohol oxidase [Irpex rosettiformis]|uniref:Alcohol oxidase n=1 Tax=Irpex rosettiformis TaxID=378272 RepID=A0ACB8TPA4_9APHY|nr:alcohol oxidase [Irpex rosettiformis]